MGFFIRAPRDGIAPAILSGEECEVYFLEAQDRGFQLLPPEESVSDRRVLSTTRVSLAMTCSWPLDTPEPKPVGLLLV